MNSNGVLAPPRREEWEPLLRRALEEDRVDEDWTTRATVPAGARATARVVAREAGVVAGLPIALEVFRLLGGDAAIVAEGLATEGAAVEAGAVLATVRGDTAVLLGGERTALNLLGRLSGIASLTARYVAAVAGTPARITDTRKTTPGWRHLEKYAVRCGGGTNHRFHLADALLIKDNHVMAAGGVAAAVRRARATAPRDLPLEVEVDTIEQLEEALAAGASLVLLDNFPLARLRTAVEHTAGRAQLEASGGIHLDTVGAVASTGVDRIAVGALTHSAPALDIGMDFDAPARESSNPPR